MHFFAFNLTVFFRNQHFQLSNKAKNHSHRNEYHHHNSFLIKWYTQYFEYAQSNNKYNNDS